MLELPWPEHSRFPNWGGVIDGVTWTARWPISPPNTGVRVMEKTEATPIIEGGFLRVVERTQREQRHGQPEVAVIAIRSMTGFRRESGQSAAAITESASPPAATTLTALDRSIFSRANSTFVDLGATMPGYRSVFPLGDGT